MIDRVDHPSVALPYDIYHSGMMGERPESVLARHGDMIGHAHVADLPGRHEPGSGGIDWRSHIGALAASGYAGTVGLEYWPTAASLDSLATARRALGVC
jgi:hydroxypyruvate isomerase